MREASSALSVCSGTIGKLSSRPAAMRQNRVFKLDLSFRSMTADAETQDVFLHEIWPWKQADEHGIGIDTGIHVKIRSKNMRSGSGHQVSHRGSDFPLEDGGALLISPTRSESVKARFAGIVVGTKGVRDAIPGRQKSVQSATTYIFLLLQPSVRTSSTDFSEASLPAAGTSATIAEQSDAATQN